MCIVWLTFYSFVFFHSQHIFMSRINKHPTPSSHKIKDSFSFYGICHFLSSVLLLCFQWQDWSCQQSVVGILRAWWSIGESFLKIVWRSTLLIRDGVGVLWGVVDRIPITGGVKGGCYTQRERERWVYVRWVLCVSLLKIHTLRIVYSRVKVSY